MAESILDSVKKVLGVDPDNTDFDVDLVMHINSVFSIMHQIGATAPEGFFILDKVATWEDFLQDRKNVNMVKSYMVGKVRLMFDPPSTSYAIESLTKIVAEMEWRLGAMELVFNPNAYRSAVTDAQVWILEEGDVFPQGASTGDIGYNPVTGNIWRFEP